MRRVRRGGRSLIVLGLCVVSGAASANMRITEYLYSGTPGEFIEFTNTGATPIDMTGWSFDDSSRVAGSFSLSGFGVVQPGESVILTEASTTDFRAAWVLCDRVKVIGGLDQNLGRGDEINLYDAGSTLIDRLTFGDQTYPGTIRTQDISGKVSVAGLGTNAISEWLLSSVSDGEGSWSNGSGNIGSPGRTVHGANANPCGLRITEYMYDGVDGEFVEFTNLGPLPLDMNGWSFDDDSRLAGTVSLSAFGTVQVGESVILTDAAASDFRTAWGLCANQKIIGGSSAGLGRNDEINLFDATDALADRLSYGDQTFAGSVRTQGASAWVSAAGVGSNDPMAWTKSTLADAEASISSVGGNLGSPGRSARVPSAYDVCGVPAGAPSIAIDATTTPRLSLGAGAGAIGAALGDPTDPARVEGVVFTLTDPDTPLSSLNVSATSSNVAVVAPAGLVLGGSDGTRTLHITPSAVGASTLTVTVSDGTHTAAYVIDYRVSVASVNPATTRFHNDAADASAAVAVDSDWMLIANDEDQVLRLYPRHVSGDPQARSPFSSETTPDTGPLGLSDTSGSGKLREVDIEGVARLGNRLFWLGSHSNNKDGEAAPNRRRLFATDLTGNGAAATLGYVDRYDYLRDDLIAWDAGNGHGLGANALGLAASSATGLAPEAADGSGFNIEGFVIAPDNSSGYIAFRAPLQDSIARNHALIVPVQALDTLVDDGNAAGSRVAGSASFGAPIFLDLGGRAIRDIARNGSGYYLILAGPAASATGVPPADFRLYAWSGQADEAPQAVDADLTGLASQGSFEGIVEVPSMNGGTASIQLIVDNGDTDWYADGTAAKDLANATQRKFRSEWVTASFPYIDGDNLEDSIENGVPGLNGSAPGDGNGDGIPDREQPHVASLPGLVGGCYFTVEVAAGLTLQSVRALAAPGDAPQGASFPCGLVGFDITGLAAGQSVPVRVIAHGYADAASSYLKRTATGSYAAPGGSAAVIGTATAYSFDLLEGGPFDADGVAGNGRLSDPGGPSVSGAPVPLLPLGLLALLAALITGLASRRLLRRT
ncbi:MAG: DUF3616 domain-containing protein [Pseudomonadota bacterium]